MANRTSPRRPSRGARRTARARRRFGAVAIALAAVAAAVVWTNARGGEATAREVLHADTRLGTVELHVSDLDTQRTFYADVLGLEVLEETGRTVRLGAADEELIRLVRSSAERAAPSEAGLYHSAILYPDAAALAGVLRRVATLAPDAYEGASDHTVSQAFYFQDPEGNGVELYVDRPRSSWRWDGDRVQMRGTALDPNAFIAEHGTDQPGAAPTVGHVHLKVGDLDDASDFYVDTLGFDLTSEIDGAIFMSAGGYHHHLAANTWSSDGAGVRTTTAGLGCFQVLLPTAAEMDALAQRLSEAGHHFTRNERTMAVDDRWGNTVSVALVPSAVSGGTR